MNKKILIIPAIIAILLIAYFFYNPKPKSFPDKDIVISSMNELSSNIHISEILAEIPLDDRHVLVPFLSSSDRYGLGYWVWDKTNWKVVRMDSSGEPYIWKIKANDPSKHYIVWNIDPKDELGQIKYYLIRDRYYSVTPESNIYTPKIQKQLIVSIDEQPYGALPFPDEWMQIMSDNMKVHKEKKSGAVTFRSIDPYNSMYVGWIPYNKQGETSFPHNSVNGSGVSLGHLELDFVRILNENELEAESKK